MMRVVARRLAYPLNDRFWRGLYAYTRDNCYLEQNRSPMNRASGSEDDVYVSEDEPANNARPTQSDDKDMHVDDARTNQSDNEDTHSGQAES
ncbi:hypothetical protein GGF47_004533, partial [Coemansia sp. RSA 2524]